MSEKEKTNKNVSTVRVISAMDISADSSKKIEDFVTKKHSKADQTSKIVFDYEVDSSILGGILIVYGDKYYDGTLKSQLIKIRKSLDKDN